MKQTVYSQSITVSVSEGKKKAGRKETVIAVITVCHNIYFSGSSGCVSHFKVERGTIRGYFSMCIMQ